ncbi:MAG TPA: Crp/Fnr family transcriptional regulator, partial [Pyrinomonadaceae bacterium]
MGSFNIEPPKISNSFETRHLRVAPAAARQTSLAGGTSLRSIDKMPFPAFNDLIKKLPGSVLRKLEPHTKKVSFDSGEYLYRPDEDVEYLYFPETAAMSELQILEDGRTIEVSITGHEGAVGLLALYYPGLSANWVQVCGPGTALKIGRDALKKETQDLGWVNLLFHEYIQSYIRQISQKVACNAHHSVEERFCTWLLMLQDRCPRGRLKLTQEHIARVLGVYRPSVTCIAQ